MFVPFMAFNYRVYPHSVSIETVDEKRREETRRGKKEKENTSLKLGFQ